MCWYFSPHPASPPWDSPMAKQFPSYPCNPTWQILAFLIPLEHWKATSTQQLWTNQLCLGQIWGSGMLDSHHCTCQMNISFSHLEECKKAAVSNQFCRNTGKGVFSVIHLCICGSLIQYIIGINEEMDGSHMYLFIQACREYYDCSNSR